MKLLLVESRQKEKTAAAGRVHFRRQGNHCAAVPGVKMETEQRRREHSGQRMSAFDSFWLQIPEMRGLSGSWLTERKACARMRCRLSKLRRSRASSSALALMRACLSASRPPSDLKR